MKNTKVWIKFALFTAAMVGGGCNQGKSFDSAAKTCVTGDNIKLVFPQNVQDCVDNNKIWNFSSATCTNKTASSFVCNFTNLQSAITALGVKSTTIPTAQKNGAHLVACGQSSDNTKIIAQWYSASPDTLNNCVYDPSQATVVTACFSSSVVNSSTMTDAQKAQAVQDCLNN